MAARVSDRARAFSFRSCRLDLATALAMGVWVYDRRLRVRRRDTRRDRQAASAKRRSFG
jgi:hypothetical protein